jgi:hypothetical protein
MTAFMFTEQEVTAGEDLPVQFQQVIHRLGFE